nr:MAG TPA: hypothetical protein [Caudoviricetes sp.]
MVVRVWKDGRQIRAEFMSLDFTTNRFHQLRNVNWGDAFLSVKPVADSGLSFAATFCQFFLAASDGDRFLYCGVLLYCWGLHNHLSYQFKAIMVISLANVNRIGDFLLNNRLSDRVKGVINRGEYGILGALSAGNGKRWIYTGSIS